MTVKNIIMWFIPHSWKNELIKKGSDEVMGRLMQDHYWFNRERMVANTLYAICRDYQKYGHWNVSKVRDEIYEIGDNKLSSK